MIRVGIIGGAGYTAGELIRLLVNHPEAGFAFIHSESNAGKHVYEVHEGLFGDTDIRFCDSFDLADADVLFLCSGHGKSREFWQNHKRNAYARPPASPIRAVSPQPYSSPCCRSHTPAAWVRKST